MSGTREPPNTPATKHVGSAAVSAIALGSIRDFSTLTPSPRPPPTKNTAKKDFDECAQLNALTAMQYREISKHLITKEAVENCNTGLKYCRKCKAARKQIQLHPPARVEMETQDATTEQSKHANELHWAKPFQCLRAIIEKLTIQISNIASHGEQRSAKDTKRTKVSQRDGVVEHDVVEHDFRQLLSLEQELLHVKLRLREPERSLEDREHLPYFRWRAANYLRGGSGSMTSHHSHCLMGTMYGVLIRAFHSAPVVSSADGVAVLSRIDDLDVFIHCEK
ncbi:hypothetical protein HPB48_026831 [Haemaphysalis longicornis]|uniref:Uncharacterized protein n=1 Tax=Haemaphysalis longicornis TaxID=44386 RepID=A0A9J6HAG7_HAELO|nr:hypothetical protein HPB48_026831 [Haemaphysalis longicornis]